MVTIQEVPFGTARDGTPVRRFTMENKSRMKICILNYGCTIQNIFVPDAAGALRDIVLGYDDLVSYETGNCCFGALVGRYANRLKNARFELDGRTCLLPANEGKNHLHGIFHRRTFDWAAEPDRLVFHRISPAGEEGFPGRLELWVTYRLTEENELLMDYRAVTDVPTILNLTNHSYFNLNGQDGSDILDHKLRLCADFFTPVDGEKLTTGAILPVAGTPLDFRKEKTIGKDIASNDPQLSLCQGYDHNFVLNGTGFQCAAKAVSHQSGIVLECRTTQPGVQLYTGNFVNEDAAPCGKGGLRYPRYGGFCLETQHFPCSPDFPRFPSTVLRPGNEFHQVTGYRFGLEG